MNLYQVPIEFAELELALIENAGELTPLPPDAFSRIPRKSSRGRSASRGTGLCARGPGLLSAVSSPGQQLVTFDQYSFGTMPEVSSATSKQRRVSGVRSGRAETSGTDTRSSGRETRSPGL
jgi:hypothetical protein